MRESADAQFDHVCMCVLHVNVPELLHKPHVKLVADQWKWRTRIKFLHFCLALIITSVSSLFILGFGLMGVLKLLWKFVKLHSLLPTRAI